MAQPIAKMQMTPKSVYFPQHQNKPPPTKPSASNYSAEQAQEQKRR